MQKPNIIVVLTDQQRWDTCGCYGQSLNVTPHLDELAWEGVLFEHAFTCQPVCGPARATLQTGKYATEVDCHTNNRALPPTEKTLAHYLTEAGYETGYIGKWHLASSGEKGGTYDFRTAPVPVERRGGYDFWLAVDTLETTSCGYSGYLFDTQGNKRPFPEGKYRVDVLTDWAIDYIRTRHKKPYFLFLSFLEPHQQNNNGHVEGPRGSKEKFKNFIVPGDLQGTEGDWRAEYPDYLGCVESLDWNLGRLVDVLHEQNVVDNTLIIFSSDHGSHFRTRNHEYKRSCHDASIRIPMVIRGPGFRGGDKVKDMVTLLDLAPTLLAAADLSPPKGLRGRKLQVLVGNGHGDSKWPKAILIQISQSHCGRAIRTHRWKYSVRALNKPRRAKASKVYVEEFLYDLQADPHERSNLIDVPQMSQVRRRLARKLTQKLLEAGEQPAVILDSAGNNVAHQEHAKGVFQKNTPSF